MAHTSTLRVAGIAATVGLLAGGALSAAALTSGGSPAETIELVAQSTNPRDNDGAARGHGMGGGMASMVSSEIDYLVDMIPHHQEAIDNAQILIEHSDREQMREFGASIVETQSAEIEQMEAWLAERYPGQNTRSDYEPMMGDLSELRGDELDREFLEAMIPHHMMAVMMSQQLVRGGLAEHDDVIPFAENIRDEQRSEIHQMQSWLVDWFDADAGHGGGMGMGRGSGNGSGMGMGGGPQMQAPTART